MGADVEPSLDVTGGVFYTEQELDEQLVAALYLLSLKFITSQVYFNF